MASDPGSTLRTARVFPIGANNRRIRQSLSSRDRIDIWKINLNARSRFNLTLNGIAKRADANVSLLNAAGRTIRASNKRGNRAEKLTNLQLAAGTFYVRVQLQRRSANTCYALTMSAAPLLSPGDRFGDNFATATPRSLSSTLSVENDAISNADPNDFIQFTLPAPGQINLSLTGLSADANLELYDRNRTLIAASANPGATSESLSQRLVDYGSTYYIRIAQAPGNETAYSLSYSLTPDTPVTTASGLRYVDLVEGTGTTPTKGQRVVAQYTGTLVDGTKFDSSRDRNQPFEFSLGFGQVIAGWDEGFSTMKVGGRRQLIIPPNLGYGSRGSGSTIPPNSTLIFDVELVEVKPPIDLFGNSFATAFNFRLGSGAQANDFVGAGDPNDFLQFTLPQAGQLRLQLTELSADANLELYDSRSSLIAASTNSGTTNENIEQRLTNVNSTYYIRVFPASGGETTYNFSYTFTP